MPKKRLDESNVCAVLQHVSRAGVAEQVTRACLFYSRTAKQPAHPHPGVIRCHWLTIVVEEQQPGLAGCKTRAAFCEIFLNPEGGPWSHEGHTDTTGDAATNLSLSKGRAESVAQALVAQGVGTARISSQGFGSTRPIGDNSTEAGRAQNRRIELVVTRR